MSEKKHIIITPETHWDREWYLPFQEYRAKLCLLIDSLLKILETDPTYTNFTLDGQTVVLEDYLEANPSKEEILKKYIKEGRISVGPFYILPDTYLEDGESMIRNLMMGHNIANKFGRVMKAGYIPDPFGHYAQMPQVLSGFGVNSVLFARGFGNEFEKLNLNMEFLWKAPGGAAEILGIHLVKGYGSVANLDETKDPKTGQYTNTILRIEKTAKELAKYTCTNAILLNNGSDHLFPQPHLPEAIRQFNAKFEETFGIAEQADFERYTNLVLANPPKLKEFEGELHGGRYQMLLSGVLSARMWIKQWNRMCENKLERYTEPISTITWMFDRSFAYPRDYIWLAWHWLIRNHPHDSICGCSVDYVHDIDMRTRFSWAEQIGTEIIKNSVISLSKLVSVSTNEGERFPIFVYNPCPRPRSTLISLPIISDEKMANMIGPEYFKITDSDGKEIFNIASDEDVNERYLFSNEFSYALNFIAEDIPPFGFKTYYIIPGEQQDTKEEQVKDRTLDGEEDGRTFIENRFYKIYINQDGSFDVFDKEENIWFKKQGILEDVGDWGDEYDFSGPKEDQADKRILSTEFLKEVTVTNFGINVSFNISYDMALPIGLSEDRKSRDDENIINTVDVFVSLNSVEKKVYIDVELDNQSEDHRIRMLFSSGLKPANGRVDADGHFMVVSRPVDLPPLEETKNWEQLPVPTHHENNFVSVSDGTTCFSVMNLGLPEYEAIKENDGTITFAITLLRSVGWLSRGDFKTRRGNAGPSISASGAQCLGPQSYLLGIYTGKGNWLSSKTHIIADEFNLQPEIINPLSVSMSMRMLNVFCFREMNLKGGSDYFGKQLKPNFSACELKGDAFQLTAFKRADKDNNALIVRVVNMANNNQMGKLILGKSIKSAELVNLNEESIPDSKKTKANIISTKDNVIEFSANGYVISTFKIII